MYSMQSSSQPITSLSIISYLNTIPERDCNLINLIFFSLQDKSIFLGPTLQYVFSTPRPRCNAMRSYCSSGRNLCSKFSISFPNIRTCITMYKNIMIQCRNISHYTSDWEAQKEFDEMSWRSDDEREMEQGMPVRYTSMKSQDYIEWEM